MQVTLTPHAEELLRKALARSPGRSPEEILEQALAERLGRDVAGPPDPNWERLKSIPGVLRAPRPGAILLPENGPIRLA